jgi:hypothetical protein
MKKHVQSGSGKIKNYVYPVREWKDYLGESLLIIFSVLLALIGTEYIDQLHEHKRTRILLRDISAELKHNKQAIQEMNTYNLTVLRNIDSVLASDQLQKRLISDGDFHLNVIAPEGVLYRYLDNEAWIIAKNNDIISKIDLETATMLTRIYEDQERMTRVEEEVARIIFERSSRDPQQIKNTLKIIRDIYHGWAVDRVNGLLSRIDEALKKL